MPELPSGDSDVVSEERQRAGAKQFLVGKRRVGFKGAFYLVALRVNQLCGDSKLGYTFR